jgi:hypothetical protein
MTFPLESFKTPDGGNGNLCLVILHGSSVIGFFLLSISVPGNETGLPDGNVCGAGFGISLPFLNIVSFHE